MSTATETTEKSPPPVADPLMGVREFVHRTLLHHPFGDRIRRGGGFTRLRDLLDRCVTSSSRQIRRARQIRALNETVEFIEANLPHTPSYSSALNVLSRSVAEASKFSGLHLEFGVRHGFTINWIAKQTDETVYGFDWFQGLPEDWTSEHRRGAFHVGKPPKVRRNVRLVNGLFEDSLPRFLREHEEPVAFIHVDSDLYSSAVTIFRHLAPRIQPGTVIAFDDYFNMPGWFDGEHKAFSEFVAEHQVRFEYLAYCHFGEQLAVKIVDIVR